MCPPVLAVAGLVASMAGSVVSGIGAMQQANAQAAAASAQAQMQRRQADIEQIAGQQEARRKQEDAQRLMGRQVAQYAGSGVTMEGSPTEVVLDTARETYLDQQAIIYNTDLKSENLRYSAAVSDMNAKGYRQAARMAPIKAGIDMVGNVASFARTPTGTQLLTRF